MAKEIEVRILLQNKELIKKKLEKQGAKIIYSSHLRDYWYCPVKVKNWQGAEIEKTGFALRIRETVDRYTDKSSASLDCKTLCDGKTHALCNEYEIDLTDLEQARKILESIGLKEFLLVDKERIIYELDDIKYCFDDIKGVGEGLEIEMMTTGDVNKAHKRLTKVALDLGIKPEEILEKSLTHIAMQKLGRF